MAKSVTLVKVKCIKPATGTSGTVTDIAAGITAIAAGAGTAIAGGLTGGLLVAATGVAAVGGAQGAEWLLGKLDSYFAGADDLYITCNDNKIWPADDDYTSTDSQQEQTINYTIAIDSTVKFELWEYDTISSNDSLGYVCVEPSTEVGTYTIAVSNEDEQNIYEVYLNVTSA